MRHTITDAQFERLPKYAREYIKDLKYRADQAEDGLERMQDAQRKTKVWTTEYVNSEHINRYFEADNIEIEHKGVRLRVSGMWNEDQDIQLSWTPAGRGMPSGSIGLIPTATQQAKLINLAYNERDYKHLVTLKEIGEKNERQES